MSNIRYVVEKVLSAQSIERLSPISQDQYDTYAGKISMETLMLVTYFAKGDKYSGLMIVRDFVNAMKGTLGEPVAAQIRDELDATTNKLMDAEMAEMAT